MLVAFDIPLMRPACVIVAAGLGADTKAPHRFPENSWLLAPTPGMQVYETTDIQLDALVAMVEKRGILLRDSTEGET